MTHETELKICLYLDDGRTPTIAPAGFKEWEVVRNYEEFVNWISTNGMPDYISFDHDLADEHYAPVEFWDGRYGEWASRQEFKEKTGLDAAKWLCEYAEEKDIKLPKLIGVHSMNPMGARNIQSLINSYKKFKGQEQNCFLQKVPFKIEP